MYLGGEEKSLSFENFPYSGFSKVFNLILYKDFAFTVEKISTEVTQF